MQFSKLWLPALVMSVVLLPKGIWAASPVTLQNATASGSQAFGGGVAATIDGNLGPGNGWADDIGGTNPNTAVWETVTNLAPSTLTFTLSNFDSGDPLHTLGRFRISATTDNRSLFADGLASGGDVTANWTVLTPQSVSATNGTILSILGDGSILASGPNPSTSAYTINLVSLMDGVTGFRLEALADASLPDNGPGRAGNGNYVLTEFQVSATALPEPTSVALWSALGLVCAMAVCWRRRRG